MCKNEFTYDIKVLPCYYLMVPIKYSNVLYLKLIYPNTGRPLFGIIYSFPFFIHINFC